MTREGAVEAVREFLGPGFRRARLFRPTPEDVQLQDFVAPEVAVEERGSSLVVTLEWEFLHVAERQPDGVRVIREGLRETYVVSSDGGVRRG